MTLAHLTVQMAVAPAALTAMLAVFTMAGEVPVDRPLDVVHAGRNAAAGDPALGPVGPFRTPAIYRWD